MFTQFGDVACGDAGVVNAYNTGIYTRKLLGNGVRIVGPKLH